MYHKALCLTCLYLLLSPGYATDVLEYTQKKLPNGNSSMDYTSSDGTRIQQVQNQDGSITTVNTDNTGRQTISKQHADGTVEVKKTQPQNVPDEDVPDNS